MAERQNEAWKAYATDFDNMTDEEIEAEKLAEETKLNEAEEFLEAVASWEAAGKPRSPGAAGARKDG